MSPPTFIPGASPAEGVAAAEPDRPRAKFWRRPIRHQGHVAAHHGDKSVTRTSVTVFAGH